MIESNVCLGVASKEFFFKKCISKNVPMPPPPNPHPNV